MLAFLQIMNPAMTFILVLGNRAVEPDAPTIVTRSAEVATIVSVGGNL